MERVGGDRHASFRGNYATEAIVAGFCSCDMPRPPVQDGTNSHWPIHIPSTISEEAQAVSRAGDLSLLELTPPSADDLNAWTEMKQDLDAGRPIQSHSEQEH